MVCTALYRVLEPWWWVEFQMMGAGDGKICSKETSWCPTGWTLPAAKWKAVNASSGSFLCTCWLSLLWLGSFFIFYFIFCPSHVQLEANNFSPTAHFSWLRLVFCFSRFSGWRWLYAANVESASRWKMIFMFSPLSVSSAPPVLSWNRGPNDAQSDFVVLTAFTDILMLWLPRFWMESFALQHPHLALCPIAIIVSGKSGKLNWSLWLAICSVDP